jgi:TRAP-type C4-dicarboxylate transport system substrate-binding protein
LRENERGGNQMKRVIFYLLPLCLIALTLLAACNGTTTEPAQPTEPTAPTQTVEPIEVFHFKYATSAGEQEDVSKCWAYLANLIEERSDGRVKFENFYGTLGSPLEMPGMLSSGAIDFAGLGQFGLKDLIPLYGYVGTQIGGSRAAMEYQKQINWEIPETSAILQGELEKNNLKILHFFPTGIDGIVAKDIFYSLDEMQGKKIGLGSVYVEAFAAMGLNPVSIRPPDMYESISRGVIDAIEMGSGMAVTFKLYEVAKCYMSQNAWGAAQTQAVNLNVWNTLPSDLQQIILDAALEAEEYGINLTDSNVEASLKILTDAGLVVGVLPDDECDQLFSINYEKQMEDLVKSAADQGMEEKALLIKKYCDQLTYK